MKDPAFGPTHLARWREALPDARVVPLGDVGHFVADEAPDALAEAVQGFLRESAGVAP
jgi:pimeloyl-ACP methyl ester carboxylesterase